MTAVRLPGSSTAGAGGDEPREHALKGVREQLALAANARKCFGCGCLHKTVEALSKTGPGNGELAAALTEARGVFLPKEYDCLGCQVCYPAIAANAFAEAFPGEGEAMDLCPTDAPAERHGWPPLPGDYHVLRYRAPVAICTLNSADLARRIADRQPNGVALVGTLHTENLGIERIIRNVLTNPDIRFLVLCGEDTQQAIGHLPGQSLASLFGEGLDERGRITGARGKRPVLKNLSREQVAAFLRQIELVSLIGEERDTMILDAARKAAASDREPFDGAPADAGIETVPAAEPQRLVSDPAGFFVVYPDAPKLRLVVEHYTTAGVLDCVIEGSTPAAVAGAAIERDLLGRLDHAAYLGRELARAERSLATGEPYVQDRAPGELVVPAGSCGCSDACTPEEGSR
jgi:tetrahydromethanopterin S-methyltransferase subunit A